MKKFQVFILAIVLVVASVFGTQYYLKQNGMVNNAPLDLKKATALINTTSQDSVTVLQHFPAIGNLEGFIVTSKKQPAPKGIVYYNKLNNYLVSGVIVDGTGANVVQKDYNTYIQPESNAKVANSVANTAYIEQGHADAPHKAYVVVDPNCIYCHKLYDALKPAITSGKLSVRWIVVGMIRPSSKPKALAILSAKDPLAALTENEKGFNDSKEEGGIAPLKNASQAAQDKLSKNMAFMMDGGLTVTPVVIYKDTSGKFQMSQGMPRGEALNKMIDSMGSSY